MASTNIDVINRGLIMLGAETIESLDGDQEDDKVTIAAALYEPLVEAIFSRYPWRFARSKQQLSRDVEAPNNEWQYKFGLPPQSVRLLAVYDSGEAGATPITRWERFGDFVMSDELEMHADYIVRRNEVDWPPAFEHFVAMAFAADAAMPVTGKISILNAMMVKAYGSPQEQGEGGAYRVAKRADASQSPPDRINDFTLVQARFGSTEGLPGQLR